jgi:triphosphatase
MITETELKLELQPRFASRVLSHPAIDSVAGPATSAHLMSVYYDTPDFDLWSEQVCLRLRRSDAGWIQTVKFGGSAAGGLHQRGEFETAVPGQTLDFDVIMDKLALERLACARFRRRIRPVFVTEFERTTRMLQPSPGNTIELALDRGQIVAGTARAPICELELELKSGTPLCLFDLARALLSQAGIRPSYRSKAERGYLLAGLGAQPVKAARVALDESTSAAQSVALIVGAGLEQIQANEDGLLAGKDIEYLHQMRVGVRRLRACLGLYSHSVPQSVLAPAREELKWFGRRLGAARDWDVFATERLPQLVAGLRHVADPRALEILGRETARLRAEARRSALAALKSRRAAQMLIELGRIAAGGGFPDGPENLHAPVRALTPSLLEKRMHRVLARGSGHKTFSVVQLHALRIAVKKLRYAVEFFGPLYDSGKVGRFRERLVRLQDCLGSINDASGMPGQVLAAVGSDGGLVDCVAGWCAHAIQTERSQFGNLWRDFRRVRPFW